MLSTCNDFILLSGQHRISWNFFRGGNLHIAKKEMIINELVL